MKKPHWQQEDESATLSNIVIPMEDQNFPAKSTLEAVSDNTPGRELITKALQQNGCQLEVSHHTIFLIFFLGDVEL